MRRRLLPGRRRHERRGGDHRRPRRRAQPLPHGGRARGPAHLWLRAAPAHSPHIQCQRRAGQLRQQRRRGDARGGRRCRAAARVRGLARAPALVPRAAPVLCGRRQRAGRLRVRQGAQGCAGCSCWGRQPAGSRAVRAASAARPPVQPPRPAPTLLQPKDIVAKMAVPGLTLAHVKSHLQKYRCVRRGGGVGGRQQALPLPHLGCGTT